MKLGMNQLWANSWRNMTFALWTLISAGLVFEIKLAFCIVSQREWWFLGLRWLTSWRVQIARVIMLMLQSLADLE